MLFVVNLSYLDVETVKKLREEHRAYLRVLAQKGHLLLAGPKKPWTGGYFILHAKTQQELQDIIAMDPFSREQVAEYHVEQFEPITYHEIFKDTHFLS